MRLLFVADGRSPIALNWIKYFIKPEHEVHLVSTFPCEALDGLASQQVIPLAMSGLHRPAGQAGRGADSLVRRLVPVRLRTRLRQVIAPSSLPKAAEALHIVIERVQPDLVHAMRIPFEGMLASEAQKLVEAQNGSPGKPPLLVSVWGNDFTLHASSSSAMNRLTHETLQRAAALHTDCRRDQKLAVELGFEANKPFIVLPGGGGVQLDIFYPPIPEGVNNHQYTVINPRGVRAYVRNDTFFHAIPLVLAKNPNVRFVCPGMHGERQVENWVAELNIAPSVDLLPKQSRAEMAALFRHSQVMVSLTTHDGTPNTLLEGMASGCFPIVGDIESLREWITNGENGLLVDPGDPQAMTSAILKAIEHPEMWTRAREKNLKLVRERAEYGSVMRQAEEFYRKLIEG